MLEISWTAGVVGTTALGVREDSKVGCLFEVHMLQSVGTSMLTWSREMLVCCVQIHSTVYLEEIEQYFRGVRDHGLFPFTNRCP